MATWQALYLQDPVWVWIALAGFLLALNLATGSALAMWPALASVLVGLIDLMELGLPLGLDALVFAMLTVAGYLFLALARRRPRVATAASGPTGDQRRGAGLAGRVGRTSGEFVNGVGRVWLDGAEWSAERLTGEEPLAHDVEVRVVAVVGGVRLIVEPLDGR